MTKVFMPSLIYLILIIIFSFISATITNLNLVTLLIISFSIGSADFSAFILAFFSGIILDLIKGQILGQSAIVFLVIAFIISLYRQKFRERHLFYSLTFTFLAFCLINYLSYKNIFFTKSLIMAVFIVPLNIIISLVEEKLEESGRLKF